MAVLGSDDRPHDFCAGNWTNIQLCLEIKIHGFVYASK